MNSKTSSGASLASAIDEGMAVFSGSNACQGTPGNTGMAGMSVEEGRSVRQHVRNITKQQLNTRYTGRIPRGKATPKLLIRCEL